MKLRAARLGCEKKVIAPSFSASATSWARSPAQSSARLGASDNTISAATSDKRASARLATTTQVPRTVTDPPETCVLIDTHYKYFGDRGRVSSTGLVGGDEM